MKRHQPDGQDALIATEGQSEEQFRRVLDTVCQSGVLASESVFIPSIYNRH